MFNATMSNYPGGFKNGVMIRGMPLVQTHPGKVFWVGNAAATVLTGQRAASDGNQGSFNDPFSTLDYAINQCVASRGDVIMIKPGHAETFSNATSLDFDKAGVAIIGLGLGSLRPTFTFDTAAAATIDVTVANVSIQGCLFVANFADVASCFTLTTAKDFTVEYCEFRDTSASLNFINIVDTNATANAADGLYFCHNRILSSGTTAATTAIEVDAAISRMTVNDNFYVGAAISNTPALIEAATFDMTNLEVARNIVYRPNTDTATGGILLEGSTTASTGMVYGNHCKTLDVAGMLIMTTGSVLGFHENYLSGTADTSGIIIPAADSDAS